MPRPVTIGPMRRLRVALGQINPTVGDFERNVRIIVDAIERARAQGATLVAFPELAITGYPPEDLLFKPAFIEANLRALDEVTRASRGLSVVVGFVDKRDDIFNAARCSMTASGPGSTTSNTCRTTVSSTRTATSRQAPKRSCSRPAIRRSP